MIVAVIPGVPVTPTPTGNGAGSSGWVATGSQVNGVLGNGLAFTPLTDGVSDTYAFEFATGAATLSISFLYVMSAANAGNLRLRFDRVAVAQGVDPSTALTAGTAFTVTPGNDVLLHAVTSTNSADLAFATGFTAALPGVVRCLLTRIGADGADTHTGVMRVHFPFIAANS